MSAYYNEIEPYAAQWLRNLIAAGHIAPGDVDTRPIQEVQADDLRSYTQCHFFAGIGGWSHALRLAGWPDERPVWTGSCACQPFSSAGKQEGHGDERHLWPHWFGLIRECRPPVIFGEQVAAAIAFGWLDEVFNDLEKESYACASAVLPACSIGKPHKRDRLWFVAHRSDRKYKAERARSNERRHETQISGNLAGIMDHAVRIGFAKRRNDHRQDDRCFFGAAKYVGDSEQSGLEGQPGYGESNGGGQAENGSITASDPTTEIEWIECPDGKRRPIKPGIRLLANGVPCRVGRLRAYGNAIVPALAAEFIKAYMSVV